MLLDGGPSNHAHVLVDVSELAEGYVPDRVIPDRFKGKGRYVIKNVLIVPRPGDKATAEWFETRAEIETD